jgi:hypothetical protein
MDFRSAVDRLRDCATREEIAIALGVSFYTVEQALLPGSSAGFRNPPPGWEKGIAKLARKRGGELVKLAEQLEREA